MTKSKIIPDFDVDAEPSDQFKLGFIYGIETASVMVHDGIEMYGVHLSADTKFVVSNTIVPTLFDTARMLYARSFPQAQTGTQNHAKDQDTVPQRSGN